MFEIEFEDEDQPNANHVQVNNHIVTSNEDDELDHKEVHEENTYALQQQEDSLATTRPKRNYEPIHKFGSYKSLRHHGQVNALSMEDYELINFKELIKYKDQGSFLVTMEEEIKYLYKKRTWKLVPLLVGNNDIGCKWLYKEKVFHQVR